MKSYEEKEPQEFFKEVCTEAIGRFEALKEFCFYARQEDEAEVNIADAVKMIVMTERTAKVIAERLNNFLLAHGVHTETHKELEADY